DLPAAVDPAYFSAPRDLETLVAGVERARQIAAAPALSAWGSTELIPGRWVASRQAVAGFVQKNAMTTYHFGGTCRMGSDSDDGAVLNPELALRGVLGVRVADASAIPRVPVSAMNAPSMLVALRAADYSRLG